MQTKFTLARISILKDELDTLEGLNGFYHTWDEAENAALNKPDIKEGQCYAVLQIVSVCKMKFENIILK